MLFIVNFMTIAFLWSVRKCQNLTMSTSVHLKEKLIHNDSYVDQKALYQYCNFYPPPQRLYNCSKAGQNLSFNVNVYNVLNLYLC